METTTRQHHTYFYQSGIAEMTPIDFTDPLQSELYNLVVENHLPSRKANDLMKKLGMRPSQHMGHTCWSSDLCAVVRDPETKRIVKWLSTRVPLKLGTV
jgi:hypothetical protein